MHVEDVEYTFDGLRLVGRLAVDDPGGGPRPAVLVAHEAIGLGGHPKRIARRLAELGYATFALDYFGDGRLLPPEQVGARYRELAEDPLRTRALGRAGLDVLLASGYADPAHLAAIGYCFGGTLALELARGGTELRAVVGFHAGLATTRPEDARNITGSVLVCLGDRDPIVPPEQRHAFEDEMRAAGADWRLQLHGGVAHSFTNPYADGSDPTMRYDARAADRSWRAMLDLFDEVL